MAVLALLTVFAGAAMSIRNAEYRGEWGEYGNELEASFLTGLLDAQEEPVDPAAQEQLQHVSKCAAKRSVQFLNQSNCKYTYFPESMSEAEHLERQDACLAAIGYEEKTREFVSECWQTNGDGAVASGSK